MSEPEFVPEPESETEPESIPTQIEYQLTTPVRFHSSAAGGQEEATFVILKAPTSRQSKFAGALRQGFMQAMREQMNNEKLMAAAQAAAKAAREAAGGEDLEEDPQDSEPSGIQVMNTVAMAEKVDYVAFLDAGKKLLASGAMLFNGSVFAKENPIEKMSLLDVEEAIGRYISNFIHTSQ